MVNMMSIHYTFMSILIHNKVNHNTLFYNPYYDSINFYCACFLFAWNKLN